MKPALHWSKAPKASHPSKQMNLSNNWLNMLMNEEYKLNGKIELEVQRQSLQTGVIPRRQKHFLMTTAVATHNNNLLVSSSDPTTWEIQNAMSQEHLINFHIQYICSFSQCFVVAQCSLSSRLDDCKQHCELQLLLLQVKLQ